MPRICNMSIQIGNGDIVDISTLGFYLIKSDDLVTAPIKDYEKQEYPESASVELYPYTTKKPFDYSVTLLAIGKQNEINNIVNSFWDSLFEIIPGSDLRKALPITIYNYWKGVQLTGYAKSNDPESHYPKIIEYEKSAYTFKLVLYVTDPRTLLPIVQTDNNDSFPYILPFTLIS